MRVSLLLILFFLSLSVFSHEDFEHRCIKNDDGTCTYEISIYQLISHPSFFHNKQVRVLGYVYKETDPYNLAVLLPIKNDPDYLPFLSNGIELYFDLKRFNEIQSTYLYIDGVFKMNKQKEMNTGNYFYIGAIDVL